MSASSFNPEVGLYLFLMLPYHLDMGESQANQSSGMVMLHATPRRNIMAAIAPITINDGKATPVAHVFNPIQTVPPTYHENDNTAVPSIGESEIIITLKKGNGTIQKAVVTLRVPYLEVQSGSTPSGYDAPPKVAYYLQANTEYFLHSRSTPAQRKDLRVMNANLQANAQVIAVIEKLESSY